MEEIPHQRQSSAERSNSKSNMSPRRKTSELAGRPNTQTSEAPTVIRQFPQEPRFLDQNYDRTGGSEAAEWRQQFVEVIENHTKDMTVAERTDFFEACVRRNKDRYIQTFAAYYGRHPELIPDRPGGVKSTRQEEDGMRESPEIARRQRVLFKTEWVTTDLENSPFHSKRSFIPDTVAGPRDEDDPYNKAPKCKHCAKEARKEKWRNPIATLGGAFASTKQKPTPRSIISPPIPPQQDGATSTATTAASSSKSSWKQPTKSRDRPYSMIPTEPAQHVEQHV